MTNENNYELIKFEDGDFSLDVNVSPNEETVWLTQAQIAKLYKIDRSRVTRHINNIISDNELCIESNVRKTHFPNSDKPVYIYNLDMILDVNVSPNEDTFWLTQEQIAILFQKAKSTINEHIKKILNSSELFEKDCLRKFGKTELSTKPTYYYNLDMILAVGYRVNSNRGIQFRRWANSILKQYLLNGQVINESRCLAHSDNIVKLTNKVENVIQKVENLELQLNDLTSIDFLKDKVFYNGELFKGYSFIKTLFNKA